MKKSFLSLLFGFFIILMISLVSIQPIVQNNTIIDLIFQKSNNSLSSNSKSVNFFFNDDNLNWDDKNTENIEGISVDGTEWIPFLPGAKSVDKYNVIPKSRDTTGFCVDSTFFGMYNVSKLQKDNRYYNYLHIPNAGYMSIIGSPALPMVIRYFEVPYSVHFTVKIIHTETQELSDFNVIPALEPHEDFVNATEPKFVRNDTLYNTNSYYPTECAAIESQWSTKPMIIRGHRILPIYLYPVQFNPVKQTLRIYSKIELRIEYDRPAQVEGIPSRLESPAFDQLCEGIISNYRYSPEFHPDPYIPHWEPQQEEPGAEYLIITHDDFYDSIQPLAEWKDRKGLKTKVIKTSDISAVGLPLSASDIAAYIKDAYETWSPAPTYILLVGDSNHIPPNYKTPHTSSSHGGFKTPTDLYYSTVDGDDYFPDIYLSRLSVDSNQDVFNIVDKIITYEQNPPISATFYQHITSSAQFQDGNNDDYEDRRFTLTAEEIRNFLLTQGYAVSRVYYADAADNPQYYNDGSYDSGLSLPNELKKPNFAWDGDATDLNTNITNGCFILYHRDHGISENFYHHIEGWYGWEDGWGDPHYNTNDIGTLTNGYLLPLVLSIECQSCWFDGEVDQYNDTKLTRDTESLCEMFVRQFGGGAIAAIGATRNSQSGYNDYLMKGFFDAVWPSFDPSYSSGGLYSFGQILNYGKMYMANAYSYGSSSVRQAFEMFHLIGDPETELWTDVPKSLDVTYPASIGSLGWQEFIVTVKDGSNHEIPYAKVCLDKGDDVYEVAYTNPDGQAYFKIYPSNAGNMNITVTKHNYRPYLGTIAVTASGASLSLNPNLGPVGTNVIITGSAFSGSEIVDIYFGSLTPTTHVTASGGSFTIDPFTVPTGVEGPLNVIAIGRTSNRAAVALFRRMPDTDLPNTHIYCQWDVSTWYLNPSGEDPRWDNPCIQLYDGGTAIASNDLIIGVTYNVKAEIYNNEPMIATDTEVTFEWAFWGAGQKTWNLIGTDTITVPAASGGVSGSATAEIAWTPSITGHICLMATIYHPWDIDLYTDPNFNKGQENTHVSPISSPIDVNFTLNNPTDRPALIYLEARQIGSETDIWPAIIKREYPQIQKPEKNKTVTFTVDAPENAKDRDKRIYVIHAYIDGKLIGGIEIEFIKGYIPPTTTQKKTTWDPMFSLGALLVLPIILFLKKHNKKKNW